jgi:hypothetical protein
MNDNNRTHSEEENTVLISIRGGMAEVECLPPGIRLVIRDYDIGGVDEDMLDIDENADLCVISEYEGVLCR